MNGELVKTIGNALKECVVIQGQGEGKGHTVRKEIAEGDDCLMLTLITGDTHILYGTSGVGGTRLSVKKHQVRKGLKPDNITQLVPSLCSATTYTLLC